MARLLELHFHFLFTCIKELSLSPKIHRAPSGACQPPPPPASLHIMDPRVCGLLLLLSAALCTAEIPVDCCLAVSKKRHLPGKLIQRYELQEAGSGCDISATVVHTIKGRQLCLPHPEGHPWVQKLLRIVDQT
uniref:Chemokine interleukin-8-like domain-containing protein n=1 Tax=Knipowitschia caucasica TaxID=637954 RepID=A0AAV2MTI6_KNICA